MVQFFTHLVDKDRLLTSTVFDVARLYSHSATRRLHETRRPSPVQTRYVHAIVLCLFNVDILQRYSQRVRRLAPVFTLSTR